MNTYELPNGDTSVRFTGELLSKKSSRRSPTDLRWTEIEIYKTQAGKYVVHKIGRSVVYHLPGQSCSSGIVKDLRPSQVEDLGLLPCPRCRPAGYLVQVCVETDRHTVHVTGSGRGVVESAHTQDDDKTIYLTWPARQALTEASEKDDAIRDAFLVQDID